MIIFYPLLILVDLGISWLILWDSFLDGLSWLIMVDLG